MRFKGRQKPQVLEKYLSILGRAGGCGEKKVL